MRCLLLCIISASALLAQTPPGVTPTAETTPAPPQASPVPDAQPVLSGYIDLGYRWVTGVSGSFATYRTIVDLGSGPILLGTDFTILNPGKRYFYRIDVRAADWGDDPYSSLHIDVRKAKVYNFSGDYRNIAYYSNLPAFADPLLSSGLILDEQAQDTRKRISDFYFGRQPAACGSNREDRHNSFIRLDDFLEPLEA